MDATRCICVVLVPSSGHMQRHRHSPPGTEILGSLENRYWLLGQLATGRKQILTSTTS